MTDQQIHIAVLTHSVRTAFYYAQKTKAMQSAAQLVKKVFFDKLETAEK
ncbi:MAG: hypothetical protein PUB43_03505 [Oscillospiraceae bacterium]|nr:hypothetical protein [Oscillospiraceae bacterium]